MKQNNEFKEMNIEELGNKLLELRKEQFNLRLKKASGSLEKTHLITLARKSIARIKTIMTEKAGV
jgi:large subunit ribosomal protein L29